MFGFAVWPVPTVEKFPRRQKFLLGDRMQATALDVLERSIEATYSRDRRGHLNAANLGIEKLRLLCRLAKDLGLSDQRRYEHAARALDETGAVVTVTVQEADTGDTTSMVETLIAAAEQVVSV